MRELVESETGAPCGFIQGASGDLAPREQYTGDVTIADRHGRSLGHAVLSALAALPAPGTALVLTGTVESGAPLAVWEAAPCPAPSDVTACKVEVEMDVQDLPSVEDLERRWRDIDPRSRRERIRRARNVVDGYVHGPTVRHPVWVWRIGDGYLVGHPGEAYSDLQTAVRNAFPTSPVMVMNLTNGPGWNYLPSRDAYAVGAYTAWQTPVAPGSLERLAEAVIDTIATLERVRAEP
jgi:hypothetical protein